MAIADNIDYDPFDRPTPGQGMTAAPGSRDWEQPSQFANPKEARRKGQNARKRCQELYDLKVMKKELTFQIEKLISPQP